MLYTRSVSPEFTGFTGDEKRIWVMEKIRLAKAK